MLAEELHIYDGDAPSFRPLRPLLDIALRLAQNDAAYAWHGWDARQIDVFLASLPSPCSVLVGVWQESDESDESDEDEVETAHELLALGCVCEVRDGQVQSIRTFESLAVAGLKPVAQLEPGIDDALEILRAARSVVAPVAYALFIEKAAWDEWLFASGDDGGNGAAIDKGEALASLGRQGRCVLMGNQTQHHHAH